MKKSFYIICVLISYSFLTGCNYNLKSNADETNAMQTVSLVETKTGEEHSFYRIQSDLQPIMQNDFSSEMFKVLKEEWSAFENMTKEQQMLSNHIFGICVEYMDKWTDAENFMGFSVYNPLENVEWLVHGNSYGIPMDSVQSAIDKSHVKVIWYGENNNMINNASVQAGYLDGDIRVTLSTTVTTEDQEYETEAAWASEVAFKDRMVSLEDGTPILIIEPVNEGEYSSLDAYFVKEEVFYNIHVVGEAYAINETRHTLDNILAEFDK